MTKVLLFCSISFIGVLYPQTTNQPFNTGPLTHDQVEKQQYEQQKAQLCTYFSQLVGNFLNIVQNPHNSAHVGGNVAEIVNNVVNIALSCIKRSGIMLTDDDIERVMHTLEQDFAEYEDVIRGIVIKRSAQWEELS